MISKETLEVRPSLFDEIRKMVGFWSSQGKCKLLTKTPKLFASLCLPLRCLALLSFRLPLLSSPLLPFAFRCFALLRFASFSFAFLSFPLLCFAYRMGYFRSQSLALKILPPLALLPFCCPLLPAISNLFRSVALCFAVRLLPLALLCFASRRFPLLALVRFVSLAMFCFCLTLLCLKLAKEGYDDYSASGCRKCNANFRKETKERKCRHPVGL